MLLYVCALIVFECRRAKQSKRTSSGQLRLLTTVRVLILSTLDCSCFSTKASWSILTSAPDAVSGQISDVEQQDFEDQKQEYQWTLVIAQYGNHGHEPWSWWVGTGILFSPLFARVVSREMCWAHC